MAAVEGEGEVAAAVAADVALEVGMTERPNGSAPTGDRTRGQAILERIRALPEDTWQRCPWCANLFHRDRLGARLRTCPECGHHFRLRAHERIATLVDPGSFVEQYADLAPRDPLSFADRLPYPDRLARAQAETGLTEAAVVGLAGIGSHPVALAVLDFAFLGGSMGSVVGEKVALAAEIALAHRVPLVAVSSSGGARMQEGVVSLAQMAKTAAAIRRLRDEGVPYISLLTDPVYGGVAASFASLGDVIIAEAGTRAGFAGPRVIEQTIRQALPEGFQTAEFLREQGQVDMVVRREELRGTLARLVEFFAAARQGPPRVSSPRAAGAAVRDARVDGRTRGRDGWEAVRGARAVGRPTTQDYIERIVTGFVELHGDRWNEDDAAVVGGVGLLEQTPVVVLGHCKGRDTAENVRRNFGMPHPSGYRKAMRLLSLAERLRVPVVEFIDTPGAYPGLAAEEANQSAAIAECLALAAGLQTPVVSVVTGEGGSGGALALAVGDRMLMQENSIFSVISPEGCAAILFGDAGRAPEAARALCLRSGDLLALDIADELIPEPEGGAQADPDLAMDLVAASVARTLQELASIPPAELVTRRQRRLRALGSPEGMGLSGNQEPRPPEETSHDHATAREDAHV